MRYLSHLIVLQYWNFSFSREFFAYRTNKTQKQDYFVLDTNHRNNNESDRYHTSRLSLPEGALDNVRGVVSPYFMYLQLAQDFDMHELIILGCLLCACPNGPWSQPLISQKKLLEFAEEAVGHRGRRKALRALNYVIERSNSIMEIFVHMLLSLPHELGGLGLKGGQFNYRISLNQEGLQALSQHNCFLDYCFPEKKIDVEYQGAYHNTTQDFDLARSCAVRQMGYDVISLGKTQLYDPERRKQFFNEVLKAYGKKLRIRTPKYKAALGRIIERLPKANS